MDFKRHSNLAGTHAFLSASNYHWLNYTPDKLQYAYTTAQAAARGTRMHALARELIEMGVRLPDDGSTLNLYVNDAIDYQMHTEQMLFYSFNCYGTADTIGFWERQSGPPELNIHDYKSGKTKASEIQLYVYDGLFCLEYGQDPFEIKHDLRIYQNDEVRQYEGDPEYVKFVMDRIVEYDSMIEGWKNNSRR